eukprot:170774-Pyramimonas_sp.AAC.1
MAEFEYTYEEANRLDNLNLNNVAVNHQLLKHSSSEKPNLDHILLLVNGNLDRHGDIKDHHALGQESDPSSDSRHWRLHGRRQRSVE